jgi:hypothetical protein
VDKRDVSGLIAAVRAITESRTNTDAWRRNLYGSAARTAASEARQERTYREHSRTLAHAAKPSYG